MVGRDEQLAVLNGCYNSDKNNLTVLYGRHRIGKTALIKEFVAGKKCIYYSAAPAAGFDMLSAVNRCIKEQVEGYELKDNYADIFGGLCADDDAPALWIIEEFHNIVKVDASFMNALAEVMSGNYGQRKVMIVLSSSSVLWVENSMVKTVGAAALAISSFLKLKSLGYADMVSMFPESNTRSLLYMYAVTGGVPGYLALWDASKDIKSNICSLLLAKDGALRNETELFVKEEFRETGVYHTILGCLASGMNKLNEIHGHTGYGRDKISVYLNNLSEREIAQKVFSYEAGGKRNVKKGLYGIKDDLINFWFRFVYPNVGMLEWMEPETFYDRYIEAGLKSFVQEAFIRIAGEFLQIMNDAGRLALRGEYVGRWYGKTGDIHIIYESDGRAVIGQAYAGDGPVGEAEFDKLAENARLAGLDAVQYFIFSADGFDGALAARQSADLMLIRIDDL